MTAKQKLFILEYLKDFNATRAAIKAGYSKDTASVIGHENLKKPYIQDEIKKAIDEILGDSTQDIVENRRFWREIRNDSEAPEAARIKASELLGRYRGMFIDKHEVDLKGQVDITVSRETLDADND